MSNIDKEVTSMTARAEEVDGFTEGENRKVKFSETSTLRNMKTRQDLHIFLKQSKVTNG